MRQVTRRQFLKAIGSAAGLKVLPRRPSFVTDRVTSAESPLGIPISQELWDDAVVDLVTPLREVTATQLAAAFRGSMMALDNFGIETRRVRERMDELAATVQGINYDEAFGQAVLESIKEL